MVTGRREPLPFRLGCEEERERERERCGWVGDCLWTYIINDPQGGFIFNFFFPVTVVEVRLSSSSSQIPCLWHSCCSDQCQTLSQFLSYGTVSAEFICASANHLQTKKRKKKKRKLTELIFF